ncbi:MAG: TetR/AcrR family transcriptional regulator [Acidimicrobiia bacterium]
MPNLWNETVEAHRHEVRHAILDTTAQLVAERGLLSVTMSEIAEKAGIGRATLYKYFPEVEAILFAWHKRHISSHLEHLADVRDRADEPWARLHAVLDAYAMHNYESRSHRQTEIAALVHQGEHVAQAQQHLKNFMEGLITEAATTGDVRDDIAVNELAAYLLHALSAATILPNKRAVSRLVSLSMDALRPTR